MKILFQPFAVSTGEPTFNDGYGCLMFFNTFLENYLLHTIFRENLCLKHCFFFFLRVRFPINKILRFVVVIWLTNTNMISLKHVRSGALDPTPLDLTSSLMPQRESNI